MQYDIYDPREDSLLVLKQIKFHSHGKVLDVGTGTGLLAFEAARSAETVIGIDVNEDALAFARAQQKRLKLKNITFIPSDLFAYFKDHPMKFDLIIFNPPYLPLDKEEPEESRLATTGGEKGYEILEKFFAEAQNYLMHTGKILVLFSTLTGKDKVHDIMEEHGFTFQKLDEEELFGETIFVYLAEKSSLLKRMEMKGVTHIRRFNKGHRGIIFSGDLAGVKVSIKQQRKDIPVTWSVRNEGRWLKVLNRKGIGPHLLEMGDDYFIYEFVNGKVFPEFVEKAKKSDIKKVLIDVFKQCFTMDKMNINKEEMHKPYKHILVGKNKTVLIDFERMRPTDKPKNTTQFCQYITSKNLLSILHKKGFKYQKTEINKAAQKYKKKMNEANFKEILKLLR